MGGGREVVDNHVRGEAAALDDPALARNEGTVFSGADDALVDQGVDRAKPDPTTPSPRADDRAQTEMTKAVCHRLAVGGGGLVDEDDEMAAESGLHVGIDVAEARGPPHPRLPHEAGHDPAIDVAAAVVAEVENQGGAVGHRVEITGPLGVVRRAHRAEMDVADLVAARRVDAVTTLLLPIGVAQGARVD